MTKLTTSTITVTKGGGYATITLPDVTKGTTTEVEVTYTTTCPVTETVTEEGKTHTQTHTTTSLVVTKVQTVIYETITGPAKTKTVATEVYETLTSLCPVTETQIVEGSTHVVTWTSTSTLVKTIPATETAYHTIPVTATTHVELTKISEVHQGHTETVYPTVWVTHSDSKDPSEVEKRCPQGIWLTRFASRSHRYLFGQAVPDDGGDADDQDDPGHHHHLRPYHYFGCAHRDSSRAPRHAGRRGCPRRCRWLDGAHVRNLGGFAGLKDGQGDTSPFGAGFAPFSGDRRFYPKRI